MSVSMESNGTGPDAVVDVTVERDQGVFLSIAGSDPEDMNTIFDYITTDPREIEQFFDEVEQAKKDWERLKAQG